VKLESLIFIKEYFESMVVIVILCIIDNYLSDLLVQLLGLVLELRTGSCTVQDSVVCHRVLSKYSRQI
jgi:hypothetical protein